MQTRHRQILDFLIKAIKGNEHWQKVHRKVLHMTICAVVSILTLAVAQRLPDTPLIFFLNIIGVVCTVAFFPLLVQFMGAYFAANSAYRDERKKFRI